MTQPEPCGGFEPVVQEWSMGYSMVHGSVRLARVHARRQLARWEWAGDVWDAALVVSELVTNAIRYGRRPGRHLWLRLAVREDGTLLIDVSDPVDAFPCDSGDAVPGEMDEGGRGLFLARGLGAEITWSLHRHLGKTVRASLPPSGPQGHPETSVGVRLDLRS